MLNGFYYLKNILQNEPKVGPKQSRGRQKTFFNLVATNYYQELRAKYQKNVLSSPSRKIYTVKFYFQNIAKTRRTSAKCLI